VTRTSGAPTFSTSQVPTRVNSPSDVEFASRDSGSGGGLTFTPGILASSFTAANSVLNGIHPTPTQTTGGDLAVTGQQGQFNVIFTPPTSLPDGHYFFVPQVELSSGDFFWLSAPRPIVPPGTPFPPGFTDLQSWTRDESNGGIDPDWLRIGTDITHQGPFNAAFLLNSVTVDVPGPVVGAGLPGLLLAGFGAMLCWYRK